MLYKNTGVTLDKHHALILKAKAAEAGISTKLMLETVLREKWPETFRIADENPNADLSSFCKRHYL